MGSKFLLEIYVEKSASAIYTMYKKSWIIFVKKFRVIVIFDLRGGKLIPFLRPHKSKKGKKSTEGVEKGTQKFCPKNVGTLSVCAPKRLEK